MTDFQFLRVTVADGVADVVIDKPPVNSLSYEMYDEISRLVDVLEGDPDVRAVVFRSAQEKIFMAGADIKDMQGYDRRRGPAARKIDTASATFLRLQRMARPTVVAITGHALGGGCEFSLAMDFRVMTEGRARIGQPEVSLGIIPGGGGTQRLTRLVGRAKATEMLMLGERLSAREAEAIGLVNRVGETDEETLEIARGLAGRLAGQAPVAIRLIKRALNEGVDGDLVRGLAVEREAMIEAYLSADADEGVAAFLEKRDPEWEGR
ncbi:MAG TPA: enoyl-CoA hydratase/isomerase family protein [Acidimicrobiia bacterium]|nr:enoyl-CoA hydratase/isomerase family protein [Acidimicrobiia bacterium]